jgi:hypothetical protein
MSPALLPRARLKSEKRVGDKIWGSISLWFWFWVLGLWLATFVLKFLDFRTQFQTKPKGYSILSPSDD